MVLLDRFKSKLSSAISDAPEGGHTEELEEDDDKGWSVSTTAYEMNEPKSLNQKHAQVQLNAVCLLCGTTEQSRCDNQIVKNTIKIGLSNIREKMDNERNTYNKDNKIQD